MIGKIGILFWFGLIMTGVLAVLADYVYSGTAVVAFVIYWIGAGICLLVARVRPDEYFYLIAAFMVAMASAVGYFCLSRWLFILLSAIAAVATVWYFVRWWFSRRTAK